MISYWKLATIGSDIKAKDVLSNNFKTQVSLVDKFENSLKKT